MTDAIKTGSILIEKGALMPESIRLESKPYSTGWTAVSNLDLNGLDTAVNQAGWTFFFMAGEIKVTVFDFDRQKAVRAACKRLIASVESQGCNCIQITRITGDRKSVV